MKLNIGSNALLFASLVSCIPRSTLGFPLTQAIDSLGPQSGHDIFNPRLGGTYGNDILWQDADISSLETRKRAAAVGARGFPKGFIPEAPRLPVPPPRAFPGGTAGLTSGPAFSSERPKALGPGDPPPRTVTPPREDPPAPKSDWKAIPEDLDPGTGKKGLDEVRSVEEYETDGHAAIAEYAEIAAGPGPDTLIGTKQPFDQILTFNSGTPAFNRIMGSPNFRSKFLAYGYHHNAIGNKVPDKVVVAPKQAQKLAEGVSGTQLYAAVIFKEAASA